ncbi:MAG: hypothetical protein OSJ48_15730, partial [Muribaculum sp.]|nr:hypothetical protein [Muribaculum sp.]
QKAQEIINDGYKYCVDLDLETLDVDLYTTSKLLGHKNIATTQIYAKIIDQKKDDAVNRVDEIFK